MCACSTKSETFPSPRNLEKDVPPSLLSSGGALSPWMVRCIQELLVAHHRHRDGCMRQRTGWSVQSPVRAFVPRHPDHSMEANRSPFGYAPTCEVGCRERFAAQSRPLFRQWITTKGALGCAYLCCMVYTDKRIC
jgi:hypothetical protein